MTVEGVYTSSFSQSITTGSVSFFPHPYSLPSPSGQVLDKSPKTSGLGPTPGEPEQTDSYPSLLSKGRTRQRSTSLFPRTFRVARGTPVLVRVQRVLVWFSKPRTEHDSLVLRPDPSGRKLRQEGHSSRVTLSQEGRLWMSPETPTPRVPSVSTEGCHGSRGWSRCTVRVPTKGTFRIWVSGGFPPGL